MKRLITAKCVLFSACLKVRQVPHGLAVSDAALEQVYALASRGGVHRMGNRKIGRFVAAILKKYDSSDRLASEPQ
jgi:hypothetical protein